MIRLFAAGKNGNRLLRQASKANWWFARTTCDLKTFHGPETSSVIWRFLAYCLGNCPIFQRPRAEHLFCSPRPFANPYRSPNAKCSQVQDRSIRNPQIHRLSESCVPGWARTQPCKWRVPDNDIKLPNVIAAVAATVAAVAAFPSSTSHERIQDAICKQQGAPSTK